MGSECVLHLYDADAEIARIAEDEIERIEQRYSRFRTDSELSQINRIAAEGGSTTVDNETAALLDYAFACHRKSEGLFDITTGVLRKAWRFSENRAPGAAEIERLMVFVGMEKVQWNRPRLSFPNSGVELDFGGICKEYAADCVASVCQNAGVTSGLVDLGGDIRAIGPQPDGSPWSIQIRDPQNTKRSIARVELAKGGLASSGDYERFIAEGGRRYSHILDPRSGWPVQGLSAASVAADTCLFAGSISTIAMLMGSKGPAWLAKTGLAHFWAYPNGETGASRSFFLDKAH